MRPLRDQRLLTVRPARVEDAEAILGHLAAIYAESNFLTRGPGDFEPDLSGQENYIRAHSAAPLKLFLVALVETELVATLTFSGSSVPRLRHSGELVMAVRKAFWNLGIGSSLLGVPIDWARATGVITKLNLGVRSDNARAIHLYQRKGFVTEGTVTREHLIDGRYFSQDDMGLEL